MTVFKSRITPLIPYTCRLPSQVEAQRMKQLKGRENALKRLNGVEPDDLDDAAYLRYSAEYFGVGKPLLPIHWQPTFLLSGSVGEHMAYLRSDNAGLTKDGGVAGLEDEEVVLAAVDRGLWDPDTPVQELRKRVDKVLVDAAKFEAKIAKVNEKVGAKELDQLERIERSEKRR
jgi:hypothetical protein